jgi:hypothetical protein
MSGKITDAQKLSFDYSLNTPDFRIRCRKLNGKINFLIKL